VDLVCWLTVVVVCGVGSVVRVVLSEKQEVKDRVRIIKVPIPIREVVCMGKRYCRGGSPARCGTA